MAKFYSVSVQTFSGEEGILINLAKVVKVTGSEAGPVILLDTGEKLTVANQSIEELKRDIKSVANG